MKFLNYSNTAQPTTLTAGVGNLVGDTSLTVVSTAGYPAVPFLLALDRGIAASEEVVLCTAVPDATHFTVERGYDGTTRKTHAIGASVEHTVSALVDRGAPVEVTTTERNALSGDNLWTGRVINNTTTGSMEVYNGTNWVPINEDYAIFAAEGTLTAPKTGKGAWPFPFPATILGITARVTTAPTGAAIIIDVNKNGTTIFSTQGNRPQIAASAFVTAAEVTNMNTTAIAAGDYLTADIDQVGSTIAGADITVFVRYRRA